MLPPGTVPEHPAPAPSSTSGGTCSGSDPFAGLYIRTAKLIRGILIVTSTLRAFVGASSLSSSASSPDRDSSSDYPEIRSLEQRQMRKRKRLQSLGVVVVIGLGKTSKVI
jgi:hypothetical protein